MRRVRLIHWNAAEAESRAATLRAAGYTVDHEPLTPDSLRRLKADPPEAVLIDISRLPAQGRDVGVALRHAKATRGVPLVFVGGEEAKVEGVKQLLPDAEYTTWQGCPNVLMRAIANPPVLPVKPESLLAGYAGTPLVKKLGIKPGYTVAMVGAPWGSENKLGDMPKGAVLKRQLRGRADLIIWFVRSSKELELKIERMTGRMGHGGMWIAWPKKASGLATDLTQALVRKHGLARGLVDYKICAIDETWSGLRFARRKPDTRRTP